MIPHLAKNMNASSARTMMILIGTDFSDAAQRAADAAAALASAAGASLTLVHVHHPLLPPDVPQLAADAAEAARNALESEAGRLRKTEVEVRWEMLSGSPGRRLLEVAERYAADLLVLGSICRKSAGERWLMGDVAEYVAEHANVPTLIIRNASPITNWTDHLEPLKILVGENLHEPSDNPLLWVKSLTDIAPIKATVAYVMWPYDEAIRYGYPLPLSYLDTSPQVTAAVARDLENRVDELMGDFKVETAVKTSWSAADLALANLVKEKNIDLLVVGTRQHRRLSRFLEHSVSRSVIHDTSANLAIVPYTAHLSCRRPVSKFHRVLVPTDFSAESNRAIPFAYSLVAPGGQVCLAHIELPGKSNGQETEERLKTLIPVESESLGITTKVLTTEDEKVSSGILHLTNRFGADAICLAAHSGSSLGLGKSPSQDLLRVIKVPVLVVHAEGT